MLLLQPDKINEIATIGEWIIAHTGVDSLRELQANAYFIVGKKYVQCSRFDLATSNLLSALDLAEQNKYLLLQAQVLNALGSIYQTNGQSATAISYYEKSLELSTQIHYLSGISKAKYNLGNLQLETTNGSLNQLKSGIRLMTEGFSIANQLKDTASIITQSSGLVNAYIILKNYDKALLLQTEAEKMILAKKQTTASVSHYIRTAKIYSDKKKYQEAINYYTMGLTLAEKYDVPRWLCMYYSGLAETYERTGNYKKANHYNQLNIKMHDQLVRSENFAAAADIQNKYERAKKDNEILTLAAINNRKSTLNKLLISSTIALLLIGFLGYRSFQNQRRISKQQEEIQQQKIAELEKNKQLIAIEAMLKGQEEERSRIAKDLHDGLGGLLSGTKLSLLTVKESLDLSSTNTVLFDKSLSMLDNTIGDLRKVAHNLMPEALVKFGLHEALRDFCDSIESSSGVTILFQQFGIDRKLNNTAEIFIYRIIQELVTNAIKHAEASQVIVQLSLSSSKTSITVEDDGKGFDQTILKNTKSAGMTNIYYRVNFFNGSTDIVTSPGNGTSVSIELLT